VDNGLEFINKELQHLLKENGISAIRGIYAAKRAERELRTIAETGRIYFIAETCQKTVLDRSCEYGGVLKQTLEQVRIHQIKIFRLSCNIQKKLTWIYSRFWDQK